MSEGEQIKAFVEDVTKVVDRYRAEFNLTVAAVVGTLHMKAHLLCVEAGQKGNEEEE